MDYVSIEDKDILPESYEPDWVALESATSESQFSEASYYLFREAAQLLFVLASIKPKSPVTSRNEATLMGLAVKMAKVSRSILRDASDGDTEQQLSMVREFLEATGNLRWLMRDGSGGKRYAMFIESGLGAEKRMLEVIESNVKKRDGIPIHIEKRMVVSIKDTLKAAGIDDASKIRSGKELLRQGFPKIEQRIESELGEIAYFAYRATSAAVHTTWSDIFKHHIEYNGAEFFPNLDPPYRRPQSLTTMVTITCLIMPTYAKHMFGEDVVSRILPILKSLDARNEKLVELHEKYLNSRGEPKKTL